MEGVQPRGRNQIGRRLSENSDTLTQSETRSGLDSFLPLSSAWISFNDFTNESVRYVTYLAGLRLGKVKKEVEGNLSLSLSLSRA